jgi:hypothetical protein
VDLAHHHYRMSIALHSTSGEWISNGQRAAALHRGKILAPEHIAT